MYIPFNQLPGTSRIWIFQSNRAINAEEKDQIRQSGEQFVNDWTAHKQTLHASFEIFHHLFFILAVDENHNDASGCSIDKSVHFIKELEKKFNITLLDRMLIAYRKEEKVFSVPVKDFSKIAEREKFTGSTPVFNNLIFTKGELQTKWEIPLGESWLMQQIKLSIT